MTSEQPPRDLAALRREYEDHGLSASDLGADPIPAFVAWLDAAQGAGLHEANAMVVVTVSELAPSARMVLLKHVDRDGFVFYTNFRSRKGRELAANPQCALLFPWHPLERQVRIEGSARRVSDDVADAYFATRPRGAQLGAWASPQSEVVSDRDYLQDRYLQESDRFAGVEPIPRPPHWGGFVVRPQMVEFWQGRPGRMHDRIRFERAADATWLVERLAP